MVIPVGSWSLGLAVLGVALLSGCEGSTLPIAQSDSPMVLVVLSLRPPDSQPEALTAVVARTSAPFDYSLRPADRFDMRRSSDARSFIWRPVESQQLFFPFVSGNYALDDSSSSLGLGRADMRPGDRYELTIETQGVLVVGTVTLPDRPTPRLLRGQARDTIVWSPVQGAAAYRTPDGLVVSDTIWTGPRASDTVRYTVTALDPQLASYLQSPTLAQSGISGALGLFGAEASATVAVSGKP